MSLSDGWTFKLAALDEEELLAKQEPSSPYTPFNRENNPSAYPSSGEGQKGLPPEPPGEIEPKQLELDLFPKAGLQDGDLIAHNPVEWGKEQIGGLVDQIQKFGTMLVGPLPGQDTLPPGTLEDLIKQINPDLSEEESDEPESREKVEPNPFKGFPPGFNLFDPGTHGNLNSEQLDKLTEFLEESLKRMEEALEEKNKRKLFDAKPDPYGNPQTWG